MSDSTPRPPSAGQPGASRDPELEAYADRALAGDPLRPVKMRHPPGLFLLFIVEMWERFSYYGMRAILVLYLTSVIAVHQLAPGAYVNALDFTEVRGTATAPVLVTQTRAVVIAVGADASPQVTEAPAAPQNPEPTSVEIARLEGAPSPDDPTQTVWAPAADQSAPVVVRGPAGGTPDRETRGFENVESRFRVTNPTDKAVTVRIAPRRADEKSRTHFTVNSKTEETMEVAPGASADVTIRANTHDSGRNWLGSKAYAFYGLYTGLAYLLPLVGGFLADRFLGTHRSMVLGGAIIAAGHVLLAISGLGDWAQDRVGMAIFMSGLALIIMGTGHFKPCATVMCGQLYDKNDPRRDGAYSIFYMGVNMGAFICAFVCGTLGEQVGWHWGFGSAAVGMIAGLAIYLIFRPRYLAGIGLGPTGAKNIVPHAVIVTTLLAGVVGVLYYYEGFEKFGAAWSAFMSEQPLVAKGLRIGLLLGVALFVVWFISIQEKKYRGPVFCIFTFIFFNAFFWLAFEQAGSTMNVFARDLTDRHVFGWEMPASWFQSVNPLLIILLAPLFATVWLRLGRRNMNPAQPIKISLGLLLLGAGFVFMVFGSSEAVGGVKVGMHWLFLAYLLHTCGELCLSPTGLSFVTKTAPAKFVALLMGIWYLGNFVANLSAGIVGSYVEAIERREVILPWTHMFPEGSQAPFFALFVVSSCGAGLLILLLSPILIRLLRTKD